jgi:hypothetical protein
MQLSSNGATLVSHFGGGGRGGTWRMGGVEVWWCMGACRVGGVGGRGGGGRVRRYPSA